VKWYYSDASVAIAHGDCREVLPKLDIGFDGIVTDPPYGLEFMGKDWDRQVPGEYFWCILSDVCKPGANLLAFSGTRTWHRLACAIEDAGWEIRDTLMWLYGQGFPKSRNVGRAVMAETDYGHLHGVDMAGGLESWGSCLKPAWEPVLWAMKPLDGTYAHNALAHGVAGLNVDGCRTATETPRPHIQCRNDKAMDGAVYGSGIHGSRQLGETMRGRYPANLLLDEDAAAMLDEQSGAVGNGHWSSRRTANAIFGGGKGTDLVTGFHGERDGLSGASRFFYTAKAGNGDRQKRDSEGRKLPQHPTVKPSDLMHYLIKLVSTPTGGLFCDPFMGSGSTLVAAKRLGIKMVGIELDEQWCQVAVERLRQLLMEMK